MHDYTNWLVYEGASEGSGRSEKIWLQDGETGEIGLFKFNKSTATTEHVSERLAYQLANLLGLPCARVEIGIYEGRVGSMSYLINRADEALIEGVSLINKKYPKYDSNTMYDESSGEYYSLELIRNSLEEYNLFNDFLKIIIFDFLIGNTDRHQNNWAVLQRDGLIMLCPIYDNGSSLCCYIAEDQIESYLGNDKRRFNSLVNTKSKSRIRINKYIKSEPTHYEMLQYIRQHYGEAVTDFIKVILEKINEDILNSLLSQFDSGILSCRKKELIRKFILAKVDLLA